MMFYVNDNSDPLLPGDVMCFPDKVSLLEKLEPWFADEPHVVFDETFCVWKLKEHRKDITLVETETILAADLAKQLIARAERIQ